jgi:hypothetical protein
MNIYQNPSKATNIVFSISSLLFDPTRCSKRSATSTKNLASARGDYQCERLHGTDNRVLTDAVAVSKDR